jgi:hypothetical protein
MTRETQESSGICGRTSPHYSVARRYEVTLAGTTLQWMLPPRALRALRD